jgi:peptidoglycan/LPS O-acetylase OafA/YrhL
MDAIALGCLTAMALSKSRVPRRGLWMLAGLGAALLIFSLAFSDQADAWGLTRRGLDMTVLAVGTCLIAAASARTRWKSPRAVLPLMRLGQRSYEVYLTHMFVVFALYDWFRAAGSPLPAVPVLFIGVILAAGLVGGLVARFYSDPMNRLLRERWGEDPTVLGEVIDGGNLMPCSDAQE